MSTGVSCKERHTYLKQAVICRSGSTMGSTQLFNFEKLVEELFNTDFVGLYIIHQVFCCERRKAYF